MTTRDIRTSIPITACDVCGRTLLRGEDAQIYVDGGTRRPVCDLCVPRALHEGWLREGALPENGRTDPPLDRRRSLMARLRSRRPMMAERGSAHAGEESWAALPVARNIRERAREPRNVHAIPTSPEHKIVSAIELFNGSEHPRTVAGVGRSLGEPTVAVLSVEDHPSLVTLTTSWELCWYRYEVDLSEEVPEVRLVDRGYELDELELRERVANAVCDEHGDLVFAG